MLATVLKGELAEQQSIFIMRAFKEMRHYIRQNRQFVTQSEMNLVTAKVSELSVQMAGVVDRQKQTEKSMEEKTIRIHAANLGGSLQIDFADNGIGIPKDHLETVFNPFFTTKESGTGLGLYILNSEIQNKGGQITVESAEGKGTVFHILLPEEVENERV